MKNNFNVGDLVRGISHGVYGITNYLMWKAEVVSLFNNLMKIKILDHALSEHIGSEYDVDAKLTHFICINELKTFDRDKVIELLKNGDVQEINTYDLVRADLSGIELDKNINLSGVNLNGANLDGANLDRANLVRANLDGANLDGANLDGANLDGANLDGANLDGVRYDEHTTFLAMQCPEEGEFIGYKKASGYIVKLKITAASQRSSATSRKCRCSEAFVLSITNIDGTEANVSTVRSNYDSDFVYRVGETARVDNFNTNRWIECATGIHFFITRQEAINY